MADTTSFPRLDDALDPRLHGHKAVALAELLAGGHVVPPGFVVPVGAPLDDTAIAEALASLGAESFAVRSSGVAEDLAEASFAGAYTTVLDCATPADVRCAIEKVRASARAVRADQWSPAGAVDDDAIGAMAVLVQRMVAADAAGVAFSKNPVTGDDEIVIEAIRSLGDRLVDGSTTGDRWVVSGRSVERKVDAGVLDRRLVDRISALVRQVAAERGAPQDIEWAVANDDLFLLQARPITALPTAPKIEVPAGRWMKDTAHFGGPVSPLTATTLIPQLEPVTTALCEEFGLPLLTIRQEVFGGEVYAQEIDLDGKNHTGAPPPWWVMAVMVRLLPSVRRRLRAAANALPLLDELPERWQTRWRVECEERVRAALAVDLVAMSDAELLAEFDRVVDEVLVPHLHIHFRLIMPNTVGVHDLVRCCKEALGWPVEKTMDLLGGLSTASVAPVREMGAIAAELPADMANASIDEILASEHGSALAAWLQRWGARSLTLDLGEPSAGERPDLVLALLRGSVDHRDDELAELRRTTRDQAHARLDGDARRRFDVALAYAERVYPLREDNVVFTEGLTIGSLRRVAMAIGTRLVAAGVLDEAGEVQYLERGELAPALTGALPATDARSAVRRRKAERAWVRAHPGPNVYGPPPVDPPELRGMPRGAMRLLGAMFWSMQHEATSPRADAFDGTALRGAAAAPGRHRGAVRIIRRVEGLHLLQPGEVLVCPTTDTNWGPYFAAAGALVLDGGGLLSHPAIIAREHGIPAVVATGVATSVLVDGQIVVVDGSAGTVLIDDA